jgi:hypothetical protein
MSLFLVDTLAAIALMAPPFVHLIRYNFRIL